MMRRSLVLALPMSLLVAALSARDARATGVMEFPDNGSEQMGRGGAWVARASDPLATFYNPAGLAGQDDRITLQSNITFSHKCFTRVLAAGDQSNDSLANHGSPTFPQVCNDIAPSPGPQLGFTWRVTDRIGVGFLPLLAPSAAGSSSWPEFVNGRTPNVAAPNRYLLTNANTVLLTPTIGAGFEVANGLRLGASFQWGLAPKIHFENGAAALNSNNLSPDESDIKAQIDAKQMFIPGFTLGALWSPTDNFDLAGWYKWSAPIDAMGDVKTSANYFTSAVAQGNTSKVVNGDTSQGNCGIPNGANTCGSGNNAEIKVPIPMEAKLGFRFHQPIVAGTKNSHHRDPLAQDQWDAEVDFTWANNSAFDSVRLTFPSDAGGNGVIPVNGTGGVLPPNANIPHNFKDVLGVRLGGDFNVVPGKLALRAGTFYETTAQDDTYQNIDFSGAWRLGLASGATYRMHVGSAEKTSAVEFSVGYGHVFYGTQDNSNPNNPGINALSGVPCNPSTSPVVNNTCTSSGTQKYRTVWPINLGTITTTVNVINVGVSYKF